MTYPDPIGIPPHPRTAGEPLHDHEFGVYCRLECPRWGNPVPQPGWEPQQDWYFTFGADHTHPDTGQRLGRNYVRIHGTCDSTREAMLQAFGNRWSNQYRTGEKAGVEEYGLTEVPMPKRGFDVTDDATHHDIWPAEQPFEEQVDTHLQRLAAERPAPVTPAEERTGVSDVQAERLNEVASLRRLVHTYGLFCEQFGAAREALDITERNEALKSLKDAKAKLTDGFDQIEQWVRGEQR